MKLETAFQQVSRLFLDSAPVIYYIDQYPAYLAIMDAVFDHIESSLIRVVTSPVTLSECLILPIRQGDSFQQQVFTVARKTPVPRDVSAGGDELML
ncbi:hypothetical protein ACKFKF_11450 [Phormidesmis sp. 146-12]